MNAIYVDPSTKRKNKIVNDNLTLLDGFPLFSIVEFNIYGNCNRSCSFCPVSNKTFFKRKNNGMSLDLFEKIMKDLKEINYSGKILFAAFSEPMLHKDICQLFTLAKQYNPKSRVEIVSNGDLFTAKKLKKMVASGMDVASVSMYDGAHQIDEFHQMIKDAKVDPRHVILRRRYYENGNYGITISNRAGLVDSNQFRDEQEEKIVSLPLKKPCFYPFYMTLVDYNGDMLLCPHDWYKKQKFANLGQENIWHVWQKRFGKLEKTRQMLSCANRKFAPCNKCDVHGDLIGKESFEAFNNIK